MAEYRYAAFIADDMQAQYGLSSVATGNLASELAFTFRGLTDSLGRIPASPTVMGFARSQAKLYAHDEQSND